MKNIKKFYPLKQHIQKTGDRYIHYGECTYYALPFPIKPIEGEYGFNIDDNFQKAHAEIVKRLKKRVEIFPNCCEAHKRLLSLKEFNRSDYLNAAEQCADKVIYTYQYIVNMQSSNIWKEIISQYIDEVIDSFGCFPEGYGEPFLLSDYISLVMYLIKNSDSIRLEVKEYVNNEFEELFIEKENIDPIAILCKIYNDWLNLIPFALPFLKDIQDDFRSKSPLFVYDKVNHDGYTNHYLFSDSQLYSYLTKLTSFLLEKVGERIAELDDIEIGNYYREFVYQEFLFKNKILDEENGQYPFTNIIKRWMENQSVFFSKLNALGHIGGACIKDSFPNDSFKESLHRIHDFKRLLEYNNLSILIDNHKKEHCLQLLFKLLWRVTEYDFNAEVNNGRGYLDFKVSKGNGDQTIIEFKLASNSKLKQNLQNQLEIYKKANNTNKTITVIFYFDDKEKTILDMTLNELQINDSKNLIIIDCKKQKESASNVKNGNIA